MNVLNWKQKLYSDESIEKINLREYSPHMGTNLNSAYSDINIEIQNQDQFLLPSDSFIYIEGKISKEDGNNFGQNDTIGFVNNGIMYLFDRIGYKINEKEIEGYSYPGQATTMHSILKYPKNYPQGTKFAWLADQGKTFTNISNKERRKFTTKDGNFSAVIPLSHLFGFSENHQKVMYGVKHALTLRRSHDNDAIIKPETMNDNEDAVANAKVTLSKISWHMPHINLSDHSQLSLLSDINNKVSLDIAFLSKQCERISLPQNSREMDWKLNVTAGSERPRYIFLAFQSNRDNNQKVNPSNFDHLHISNVYVQLNSERYPEENLNIDFSKNHFSRLYKMAVDYHQNTGQSEAFAYAMEDFKDVYPIFVLDVSRQAERLKNTPIDVRIKASFKENLQNDHVYAYAVILSDKIINLQSDGNKMIIY